MKKVVFILAFLAVAVGSFAQENHTIDFENPYASVLLSYFDPKIDETFEGSQGNIYLETESFSSDEDSCIFWIRYENHKYYIQKGDHMYLKLANGDIIILTCMVFKYSTKYYNYESYFNLDTNTINKLKESEVVKVRIESKYGVTDDILLNEERNKNNEFTWHFYGAYNVLNINAYLKHKKELKQQELNNNPLSGF